jgi:hypothetical protein
MKFKLKDISLDEGIRSRDQSEQINQLEERVLLHEREVLNKDLLAVDEGRLEIIRLFLQKKIKVTIHDQSKCIFISLLMRKI